jgi:hypothetical protein
MDTRKQLIEDENPKTTFELYGQYHISQSGTSGYDADTITPTRRQGSPVLVESLDKPPDLLDMLNVTIRGRFTGEIIDALKIAPNSGQYQPELYAEAQRMKTRFSNLSHHAREKHHEVLLAVHATKDKEEEHLDEEPAPVDVPPPAAVDAPQGNPVPQAKPQRDRPLIAHRKKTKPNTDTPKEAERELLEILKRRPTYDQVAELWEGNRPVLKNVFDEWCATEKIVVESNDDTLSLNDDQ